MLERHIEVMRPLDIKIADDRVTRDRIHLLAEILQDWNKNLGQLPAKELSRDPILEHRIFDTPDGICDGEKCFLWAGGEERIDAQAEHLYGVCGVAIAVGQFRAQLLNAACHLFRIDAERLPHVGQALNVLDRDAGREMQLFESRCGGQHVLAEIEYLHERFVDEEALSQADHGALKPGQRRIALFGGWRDLLGRISERHHLWRRFLA